MYLAKLEITKNKSTKFEDAETRKAFITVFDNNKGDPILRHNLEGFEKLFDIIVPFDYHGDVYFVVKEK